MRQGVLGGWGVCGGSAPQELLTFDLLTTIRQEHGRMDVAFFHLINQINLPSHGGSYLGLEGR